MARLIVALIALGVATPAWSQEVVPSKAVKQDEGSKQDPVTPTEPEPGEEETPTERPAPSVPFRPERPTRTFGPWVLEPGAFAIEAGGVVQADDYEDIDTSTSMLVAAARLGVATSLEAFVEVELFKRVHGEYAHEHVDGTGLGDTRVGMKWGMLTAGPVLPAFATVALWKIPTGSEGKGLGTGQGDLSIIGVFGRTFLDEKLEIDLNLGFTFISVPTERGRYTAQYEVGLAGEYTLEGGFLLLGEYRWISPLSRYRGAQSSATAGAAWYASGAIRLDAAVTVGFSEDSNDYQLLFGIAVMPGKLF